MGATGNRVTGVDLVRGFESPPLRLHLLVGMVAARQTPWPIKPTRAPIGERPRRRAALRGLDDRFALRGRARPRLPPSRRGPAWVGLLALPPDGSWRGIKSA